MDIRSTIIAVINTLNQIPVNGKLNLDRLLGSITALEQVAQAIDTQRQMDERDKKEGPEE